MDACAEQQVTLADELERCRDWIESALAEGGGTHDFSDICEAVATGAMQLWPAPRACAITEIIRYPRKKVLHIFLAAGNMNQIVDMDESATHFARMNGCDAVTIAGRRGWKRVLSGNGYQEFLTTLSKEVTP